MAWFVKVGLIWENGGSNTTEGMVGLLFSVGALSIALAAGIRAWHSSFATRLPHRILCALAGLVAFVAAVNLPIPIAWQILGHTWFAEEVGVLLTASLSVALGQRWLRNGFGSQPERRRPLTYPRESSDR